MQHKRYEEVYRGHSILLEVEEEMLGGWSWYYMIDGRVSLLTGHRLKDATTAAQQGMLAARARVEELAKGKTAVGPEATLEKRR
jgi:hypothetical protein